MVPVAPVDRHALRATPVELARGIARTVVVRFNKFGELRYERILYARAFFAVAAQERRHGFRFRFITVYDHTGPLSSVISINITYRSIAAIKQNETIQIKMRVL